MMRTLFSGAAIALTTVGGAMAEETEPVDQTLLNTMISEEGHEAAFVHAFEAGDELTEAEFTAERGVGAHVGEGRRFARFPRADLTGDKEWASHTPRREGGPNATSCISCHNAPAANGAGGIAVNVLVDPGHTATPSLFLERNTPHLFALAAPQRLAEEMSMALYRQRDAVAEQACDGGIARGALTAKGVSFGHVSAMKVQDTPCKIAYDWSELEGVDEDLVIRPFGWKGNHATIRGFTRDAAHNELGLQAVELVGAGADGDHDGVADELTVGDMTALTMYMAGLERPVSTLELADLGLETVSDADRLTILTGEALFTDTGCASCHTPEMRVDNPVFSEPSATPGFHDVAFPAGGDPADHGLLQELALWFDMTADQPNNRIELADGGMHHLGALEHGEGGGAVSRWFTDFKRHDMGPGLADPADPLGIGAEMWLTRSLAGVGSTGPWLHDGRATTLEEAILTHGGEARESRDAFAALPEDRRMAMVAFLESLVIYTTHEEEE